MRRECLDWLIPISAPHLRSILKTWVGHYNESRPHMALEPDVPDPPARTAVFPAQQSRHRTAEGLLVLAKSVLGGSTRSRLPSRDRVFVHDRALAQLGIQLQAAYSPEARGRSERAQSEGAGASVCGRQPRDLSRSAQTRSLRCCGQPHDGAIETGRLSGPTSAPLGGEKADNSFATKPDRSICSQQGNRDDAPVEQ